MKYIILLSIMLKKFSVLSFYKQQESVTVSSPNNVSQDFGDQSNC